MSEVDTKKPKQSALSEGEWFDYPWTREDLRKQYADKRIRVGRREHAFYRYWQPYVAATSHILTREEVEELLSYCDWTATGSIIGELAKQSRLPEDSKETFLKSLPLDSWASKQIQAVDILGNSSMSTQDKVSQILALRAWWGIVYLAKSLTPAEKIAIAPLVEQSVGMSRRIRHDLMQVLKKKA